LRPLNADRRRRKCNLTFGKGGGTTGNWPSGVRGKKMKRPHSRAIFLKVGGAKK